MNTCILCSKSHNYTQPNGDESYYCEPCADIKKTSEHTLSHITDYVYLSGMNVASHFTGTRLYVHEDPIQYEGEHIHVPILIQKPLSVRDRSNGLASIDQLDKAADIIEDHVRRGDDILIHCKGGVERSPLTIAWWLVKSKRRQDFDRAYEWLKLKRPVVSKRLFWLPK